MYKFWDSIISPLFDILQPREIVEIGADHGFNTRRILDFCRQKKARAHIIDPLPKFDPEALKNEYGEVFTFYPALSLNALPLIGHMDAVLIDGDHNWYTVYHELKLIEKKIPATDPAFPLIIVHDVAWPYARRDLYYYPENIPEAYRMPYLQKGIDPEGGGLVEKGGLNPHLFNAIYEHNFRSGVLTAIEDFIKETDRSLELIKVPVFHGLGILYPSNLKTSYPSFLEFTGAITLSPIISNLFQSVEKVRIKNIIAHEETNQKLRELEKTRRLELEEKQQELRKAGQKIESLEKTLEKTIALKETQIKTLEEKRKNETRQWKAEIETGKIRLLELEEKRKNEAEYYQQQIEKQQQQINKLNETKLAIKGQRDQLSQWIKQLRFQFDALVQSKRWKVGHALVGLATLSVFKKHLTMATDHMIRIFKQYDGFDLRDDPPARFVKPAGPAVHPKRRYNLTVAVIAWDVGHNPLGRAYMLAEALSRYFHVILLGPSFSRYNDRVWEPLKNSEIEVLQLPGKDFPEFLTVVEKACARIEADIIVACKSRLPSIQLGLMMKQFKNRPLFIDVDDDELSFFQQKMRLSLNDITDLNQFKDISIPFEETWTRFAESLLPYADGIMVSNHALGKKFGGMVIPHARDASRFDPVLYDKNRRRRELGMDLNDKIVLFLGTPREHKGVTEVLSAIQACGNPGYKLCVMGTPPEKYYEDKIRQMGGDTLIMLPDQPFEKLAENLMIADLVCLIQKPDSDISKFQLPAKVIDALAMGIPVLATATAPLEPLIKDGVVEPVDENGLARSIDRMLSDIDAYRLKQLAKREIFLKQYSYDAIGEKLFPAFLHSLSRPRQLPREALDFINIQRRIPPQTVSEKSQPHNTGVDIVFFWKQNDTGIYGRRSDMLIKYLSRRPQIRRIAVFDMPISVDVLREKSKSKGPVHDRKVYKETLLRNWGVRDTEKTSFHTFIFSAYKKDRDLQIWRYPDSSEYLNFIETRLREEGIRPDQAVFWFYPQNSSIPQIVKQFKPKINVIDLVDDHRTWSEVNEIKRLYITKHYKDVLKIGDLALANCVNIQQSMQRYHPDIKLIPNGCELEPPPELIKDKDFQNFKAMPGVKIGYVGNLEKDKLDLELIRYTAERKPDWNIVLIGSTHANPQVLELKRFSNIHFMGVIEYPDVRTWIKELDAAILPHVNSEKTRSMNPLKLYVYCSLGVPVVSTNIENLDELKSFISIAETYDDFILKIEKTLEEGKKSISPDLMRCLEKNTWDSRVDQILKELDIKIH
jgi:glycosyltransferase involved in cell wall biosynthesis